MYKSSVEVFSMSIIIISVETGLLTQISTKYPDQIPQLEARLEELSPAPEILQVISKKLNPIAEHNIYIIFNLMIAILGNWNSKKIEKFDHSKFKEVIEYLMSGAKLYQEFILRQLGYEEQAITQLMAVYDSFTQILVKMVRKNVMATINQRPGSSKVIDTLQKCFDIAKPIEEAANIRRARDLIII